MARFVIGSWFDAKLRDEYMQRRATPLHTLVIESLILARPGFFSLPIAFNGASILCILEAASGICNQSSPGAPWSSPAGPVVTAAV